MEIPIIQLITLPIFGFKIDLIVWKSKTICTVVAWDIMFKIDLIVWKLSPI